MALITRKEEEYTARVLRQYSDSPLAELSNPASDEASASAERLLAMDVANDDGAAEATHIAPQDGTLPTVHKCSLCYRTLHELSDLELEQVRRFGLTNVRHMDMRCNFISRISDGAFCGFEHSLTYLNLSANRLDEIPSVIALLVNLKHLHMCNNRISATNGVFASLPQLRVLDLQANRLAHLGDLYSCTRLQRLFLSCNELEEFDPTAEVSHLDSTDGLLVAAVPASSSSSSSASSTSASPAVVFNELQVLGVFGNKLTRLQHTVQVIERICPNVERLTLAGNPYVDHHNIAVRELEQLVRQRLPKLRWLERNPVLGNE